MFSMMSPELKTDELLELRDLMRKAYRWVVSELKDRGVETAESTKYL